MANFWKYSSISCKNCSVVTSIFQQSRRNIGCGPILCSAKYADGPIPFYDDKITSGELQDDPNQRVVIERLQDLHEKIKGYRPKAAPGLGGIFSRFFQSQKSQKQKEDAAIKYTESPLGLYLYGSVGTGKTMLMDFFYHTCHVEKKQRIHFHQFMLDIHKRLHKIKLEMAPVGYNLNRSTAYDPIPPVAKAIAEQSWLLCFDEFQVTDIADAMILKRLFSHLWLNGVVIIATSNRKPDDLYKNGLQRINFLPFIPMAKANFEIVALNSIDYRRMGLPAAGMTYFVSSEMDADYEMHRTYEDLVSRENAEERPRTLTVLNRQVFLPKTCGRILDTTFKALCLQPLGPADYLELSNEFDTILLRDIPVMTMEDRPAARRFITLIDTLYDNKVRLVCSAAAPAEQIFAVGNVSDSDKHHQRILIGDLDIKRGDENEAASIFTGEEELFAFERVVSRLTEMRSADYWEQREAMKSSGSRTSKKKL